MKIFISAMVLCVLQCQTEAGRRQISPNAGNVANGSVKKQISTDDLITTSNRPGYIVSAPTFSRLRNRSPPYVYGRQSSPNNMITPNGGKRRRGDGYSPDDRDITRHRYPWDSYYGNGRQDPDDMIPTLTPYGRPWNGYERPESPDDMMTPNGDHKRQRDNLYPTDVRTDPPPPPYPPYPPYYGISIPHRSSPIPGRQYSTDDMNMTPNRPWDTRPFFKRNSVNRLFLRDNEMTKYLIAKLKLMKDMFDYYEWGSLSAMVDRWIATLKDQENGSAAPAVPDAMAPAGPPPDDNYQYYPNERNSKQERMPFEPCRAYDTRPFCLGL